MATQRYVGWLKVGGKWSPLPQRWPRPHPVTQDACQAACLAAARGGRIAVLPEGLEPAGDDGVPVLTVGQTRPKEFDPPAYRYPRKSKAA